MLRRAPALRHAGVVFIRKTATRARRDGGSYTSFRLVESLRSGQACLLEPDPALLGEAERIAEALRLRGLDAPGRASHRRAPRLPGALAGPLRRLRAPRVARLGSAGLAGRPAGAGCVRPRRRRRRGAGRRPHGPSLFRTRGPRLARRLFGDPRAARPGNGPSLCR